MHCHNSNFRFTTKVRAWKGVDQKCNPGVRKNVREWAHTLPSGLPFWELKSLWNPKSSKSNLKSQNSWIEEFLIPLEIFLRLRYLKWALMIHLNPYNTSYGQKKGRESKCQFDSQPLKVNNHPELHACKKHAIYLWKDLIRVIVFLETSLQFEVCTRNYGHPKW